MKNVHILPTDKPSRLIQRKITKELKLSSLNNPQLWNNVNIYITSDEEIKEEDWCISIINKLIFQATYTDVHNIYAKNPAYRIYGIKKIIFTTDPDLIADGVQAIDDEFLEWFVKNSSCEYIKIDIELYPCDSQGNEIIFSQPANLGGSEDYRNNIKTFIEQEHLDNRNFIKAFDRKRFKIIIPQEEPKQEYVKCTCANSLEYSNCGKKCERILDEQEPKQETLEEVAERILANNIDGLRDALKDDDLFFFYKGVVQCYGEAMAKWQTERMYSEEEQLHLLNEYNEYLFSFIDKDEVGIGVEKEDVVKWFEQFKKK